MKIRSQEKELIDQGPAFYSQEEYQDCLKKLFLINRLLGLFKKTLRLLKKIPGSQSLCDIGCGGGLFLLHLSRHHPEMALSGLDVSAAAIQYAQKNLNSWHYPIQNVNFEVQPSNQLNLADASVDIILTNLVCHHIEDEALVDFLKMTYQAARHVVIIHDLHRHKIAYWFYKYLSPLLFRNRLITHDGLISIQRGFTRREWLSLLQRAQIFDYQVTWFFPFWWRVILWKK
jgi:2-polyprenyl-3-methyl-5-hydroxy-6-metoxy-1,4-benzoquinol methylase